MKGTMMDPDEIARRQMEQELEEIGEKFGMQRSVCIANWYRVGVTYDDAEGNQHHFEFAPVGEDAVFPKELSS